MRVRVVIVDDHAAFRRSARRLLERDGFDVVGEAADGSTALALARDLRPELVLLDVALPDMSGFDVADGLTDGPRVVLTSSRDADDLGPRLATTPAIGFVPKERLTAAAIRALLEAA